MALHAAEARRPGQARQVLLRPAADNDQIDVRIFPGNSPRMRTDERQGQDIGLWPRSFGDSLQEFGNLFNRTIHALSGSCEVGREKQENHTDYNEPAPPARSAQVRDCQVEACQAAKQAQSRSDQSQPPHPISPFDPVPFQDKYIAGGCPPQPASAASYKSIAAITLHDNIAVRNA